MSNRTGRDRGQAVGSPRKKRGFEGDGTLSARHGRATTHDANAPHPAQRSRIVAEQLYEWCAQRDDSGYIQLINDTVRSEAYALCETDPCNHDVHIVLCSDGFSHMTGYSRSETIGRPISMLHGSKTSQDSANQLDSAVTNGAVTTIQMMSYTRSGQTFWNMVHVVPVPLETATEAKLAFVLLTNVSEHLLCGRVGQFPVGLDFLSESNSEFQVPRMLLGASLVCRAEHAALSSTFADCDTSSSLSFCIVNPSLDFCPISFASDAFLELNRCDAQSVLGQSCCLAGGLPTDDEGQLETLLQEWSAVKLPLVTRMICFCKGCSEPIICSAWLAPVLTQTGALARIIVVTHEESTNDTIPQESETEPHPIRHVLKQLADAETTEGSCVQFFLRLQHARCQ